MLKSTGCIKFATRIGITVGDGVFVGIIVDVVVIVEVELAVGEIV
jgi:hypothetical protein